MSRTALLGWELGAGLEHVRRLTLIADTLQTRGWRVVLAVRNLDAVVGHPRAARHLLLQSPISPNLVRDLPHFQAGGFAELIAAFSFGDPANMAVVISAWDGLLRAVRPDVVVADYSPFLAVAAHGRIPVLSIGDGFVCPPAELPGFPLVHDRGTRPVDEQAMLRAVNALLERRRAPPALTLPRLVAGADQVVCTYPELDVYAGQRARPATGPLTAGLSPMDEPGERKLFFYLAAEFEPTLTLLEAVAAFGLPAHGYIRSASPERVDALRRKGVMIYPSPRPIAEMLAGASMVIHHGGVGTSEAALAAGRPQLLAPRHLEQALNARSLLSLGVAGVLKSPFTVALAHEALRGVLRLAGPDGAPAALARDLANRPEGRSLAMILDACEALVGRRAVA